VGKWCRRYGTKQKQQHLLLLLTKRDTKLLQAPKEIEERELHNKDFAKTQKCKTNRKMPDSKRPNWKPRAWEFPAGMLKRGVSHAQTWRFPWREQV
jgi:hypothetical protein